ncbi:MAG: Crp/Fnr family transcriptional regulator [Eubacteriales bacterium]|nr:Crp/Fnr family transcriptional regulator [Eubacteriales bacterium]
MKKYFDSEILRECPLFYDIADEDLLVMLDCLGAKVVSYKKRETIMSEGEPARNIGIVLSGAAQIIRVDYFGNRSIVADLRPAELFGESFACAGVEAVPVDVVATEDTEALMIDCLRITQSCTSACEFHRKIIYNLLKVVATKNLMFHQKIEITSKRSTRAKLIAYLLFQAQKNKSDSFEIPYNRQELADYLGVERTGLSVEISKLCKEGLVETEKKRFRILKNIEC